MRCLSGLICAAGLMAFAGACSDVLPQDCPPGQVEHDGRCVDPCDLQVCDDGNDCTEDDCTDLEDGTAECSNLPKEDDATCTEDGVTGWCVSGECDFCAMVNCDDGSACTLGGTCNTATGLCEGGSPAPDGEDCLVGGNPGKCKAGVCESICKGVVCDDQQECTTDTCDPADGECVFTPVENGTPCDLGSIPGRCTSGACTDASPPSIFLSVGGGVMDSDQYQMGIAVGGPVGQGTASSPNYTLELYVPVSQ